MGKKKAERKLKKLKRKMAILQAMPAQNVIDSPECDPQTIWREQVADYAGGFVEEDGRGWKLHGYL